MKKRSQRAIIIAITILLTGISVATCFAEEQFVVLPVVVGLIDGANQTQWESRVRILRTGNEDVTIRRVWVALPNGGFIDDPATAPTWGIQTPDVSLALLGTELLVGGEGSIGAVQLAINGGAFVLERIANTADALPPTPVLGSLTMRGPGQMVPAISTPLTGPSSIPWANHSGIFRNNLGIVNPNEEPMEFEVSAIAIVRGEIVNTSMPYPVTLPSYGFVQLNQVLGQLQWEGGLNGLEQVFVVNVKPVGDGPYFTYGSLVYTGANDPQYVAPVAGSIGVSN